MTSIYEVYTNTGQFYGEVTFQDGEFSLTVVVHGNTAEFNEQAGAFFLRRNVCSICGEDPCLTPESCSSIVHTEASL